MNVCTDKRRPGNRQYKVEFSYAVISCNYDVNIFDAGIKDTVHKARNRRAGRENARHLLLKKELITRTVGGEGQGAVKLIRGFVS